MKVLIIENEKPASDKLQSLLNQIDPNIDIVGITESVEESVNWLQSMPSPDLILMDIQLDDGTCFEIFDTIKVDIPVIFTTAFNEFVLRAFKVNSIDYLLKPIEARLLQDALTKFRRVYYKSNENLLRNLFDGFSKQYKNRFLIKIGTHFKSITTKEITCFYIMDRAVFLKTIEGKEYAIDYSLDQIEKIIDPDKFFRLNRHFIAFIDAIADINSYSSSRLQIKMNQNKNVLDKNYMVVSREKVREFKKWIDK